MAGRVTRDPATGVATIELSADAAERAEELQDPEVVEALAGESSIDPEAVDETSDAGDDTGDGVADDAEPVESTTAEDVPAFLPRHIRPSEAAKQHVLKRIMEGMLEIDGVIVDDLGKTWNGVKMVPVAHIIAVATEELPAPNAFNSEVQTGAAVTVWTKCTDCGELYPDPGQFGSEYKAVTMAGIPKRTLKSKWRSEGVSHTCGQPMLPLGTPPVPGQTEAFPAAQAASEPEAEPDDEDLDPEGRVTLENDTIKLLERVEEAGLIGDELIGIPPEEEVRAWSTRDLRLAYEWAWSWLHMEAEHPPVPVVLRRPNPGEPVDDPVPPAVPDFGLDEPTACSHEGRGLPDCTVCFPAGEPTDGDQVGTGDPDGDLLP